MNSLLEVVVVIERRRRRRGQVTRAERTLSLAVPRRLWAVGRHRWKMRKAPGWRMVMMRESE
jgi:hypothetical protein